MKQFGKGLLAGAVGGLLGGLLVGLTEGLLLAFLTNDWSEPVVIFWAMTVYGIFGLLGGAGLGAAVAPLLARWLNGDPDWWLVMAGVSVFGAAGLIVIRFRLMRDLLQEAPLFSTPSLILHGGLLLFFGGVWLLTLWLSRGWIRRTAKPAVAATAISTEDAPTATPKSGGQSRRTILKAGLAGGALILPAVALASQQVTPAAASSALTTVFRTGLPRSLRTKPNVIMIVVDTLRADHLGAYGYAAANTPHIDALAADSVRYANMFTQAAWTKPSMATMFTSLYPQSHGAVYKTSALPAAAASLPQVLNAFGYATGGYANNVNIAPLFNFHRGFDDYEFLAPDYLLGATESISQLTAYQTMRMVSNRFLNTGMYVNHFYQPAEVVNEKAMRWIKSREDDRFFLFLHYMEPHDPYFEHPYNGYGIARVSTPNPTPEMAPEMIRLYDGEIAHLDRYVGDLVAWLKQEGLYDETMIVFTADHGEEFYEHGGWWHGLTLYDEQIHVPLFIKMPNQARAGEVDESLARSLDLAPTILRGVGLDVPEMMMGLDLQGETRADLVFAQEDHEGNVLSSVRGHDWKLMEANAGNPRGLPEASLFDLLEDPGEFTNLVNAEPDKRAQLAAYIGEMTAFAQSQAVASAQSAVDSATAAQLRNLGY